MAESLDTPVLTPWVLEPSAVDSAFDSALPDPSLFWRRQKRHMAASIYSVSASQPWHPYGVTRGTHKAVLKPPMLEMDAQSEESFYKRAMVIER